MTTSGMQDAWNSWGIDENALGDYPADKITSIFRHACLLGYMEKIDLVHPYIEHAIDRRAVVDEVIKAGRLNVLKKLGSLGWDLKENADEALMTASSFGYGMIVEYLLDAGADPAAQNGRALDIAARVMATEKDGEVFDILLRRHAYDVNILFNIAHEAAINRWMPVLDALGAKYDMAEGENRLLLSVSKCESAMDDVIDYLAAHGADATARQQLCLRNAIKFSNVKNIAAFCRAGCDPLLLPAYGWEMLQERAENVRKTAQDGIDARTADAAALYGALSWPHDLLTPVDQRGLNGLMVAARAGRLDDVVRLVSQMPEDDRAAIFNVDVLTDTSACGVSVVDIAMRTGQHEALFDAGVWRGRAGMAQQLLARLPKDKSTSAATLEAIEKLNDLLQHDMAAENRLRQQGTTDRFRLRPRGGNK